MIILPFDKFVVAVFLIVMVSYSLSQERAVNVSLDIFTPFVNQDKSGLTLDLFEEIERNSDLKFNYNFDHYDKVKLNLFQGKADVVGHVPITFGSKPIEKFGQYIDLQIDMIADFYVTDINKLNDLSSLTIGTIRGNRQAASSASGLSISQFVVFSDNENMFNNLKKGTIDAIYYERLAIMSSCKELDLTGVYYQQYPMDTFQFGFLTGNDEYGKLLKKKLDAIIRKIDINGLLGDREKYFNIPQNGLVENYCWL